MQKRERHWSLWRSNIAGMTRWEIPKRRSIEKSRKKISMTASYYLMRECGRMDIPCRFDVAAVLGEQIEVVKNAFEYLP